jgi:hypothetical protein
MKNRKPGKENMRAARMASGKDAGQAAVGLPGNEDRRR